MSDLDPVHDAVERLEWAERGDDETPASRFRAFTRRTALTGGAAGMAALLLQACGGDDDNGAAAQGGGAERHLRLAAEVQLRAASTM